jgi:hypothetical protein
MFERATPVACDEGTVVITVRAPYAIDAVDDAATTLPGCMALTNDGFAGSPATASSVRLTQVSSTSPSVSFVTSSGAVYVAVGDLTGIHTLRDRICEIATPANCDEATVTLMVNPFVIDAVEDVAVLTHSGCTWQLRPGHRYPRPEQPHTLMDAASQRHALRRPQPPRSQSRSSLRRDAPSLRR